MNDKLQKLLESCIKIMGTNRALAKYLGSNERTIYRWLAGESKPGADYIMAMYDLVIKKSSKL